MKIIASRLFLFVIVLLAFTEALHAQGSQPDVTVIKHKLHAVRLNLAQPGYGPNIITRSLASELKVRNDGAKTVYVVNWDYVLVDRQTGKEVMRFPFQHLKKIPPGKTETLISYIDMIHSYPQFKFPEIWKIADNYSSDHYQEQAVITYIGYMDNTTWHPSDKNSSPDGAPQVAANNGAAHPPALKKLSTRNGAAPQGQAATEANSSPEEVDEGEVVRVNTQLVTVPVVVTDANGRYITDMKADEFHVFEDGVEQQVASFSQVEEPFFVILLLDTSGSTSWTLDKLKSEAIAFVDQLRPNDYVYVVAFNSVPHALHEKATNDHRVLREAILSAQTSGSTSLYDAVHLVNNRILKLTHGRKALVLFTDGLENSSQVGTKKETLSDAEELDALIYTVKYSSGVLFSNDKYLKELAEKTGGRFYKGDDEEKIRKAFTSLAEELRRQYSISYYPKSPPVQGQSHNVKVVVTRPGVKVKSRKSYVAK